eukprot:4607918-Amphidinium_carterae.3
MLSGQLDADTPAKDLRERLRPTEPEIEPSSERSRPLVPVPMTSKLWWIKMIKPTKGREQEAGTSGVLAEAPAEEPSFKNTSRWRNLVRAWEMRNHEKLKHSSWNEVLGLGCVFPVSWGPKPLQEEAVSPAPICHMPDLLA